ncbi:MAG TPA: gamma-glutamylcyclotransferase family protein [Terriglobia bacterium]
MTPNRGGLSFLFVYGSLMQGLRDDLLQKVRAKFVGAGTIQAKLYDLGRYPGAKPSTKTAERVRGEVHRLADPEAALEILDRYEEYFRGAPGKSQFVRQVVRVTLDDGGQQQAWAYFYNRPVDESRLIPSGDYRVIVAATRR